MVLSGIDPRAMAHTVRYAPRFAKDWFSFRRAAGRVSLLPVLRDYADQAGDASSEYFLADLWMARRIVEHNASRHVDVGSRLDGLIGHLLTVRSVEMVDIRPLTSQIEGLSFVLGDATSLAGIDDVSWPSVSSVHAVEHFGLGRYGDPIDVMGHDKGMRALARVASGRVFFGVPVGRARVEFNAHRVLDPLHPLQAFAGFDLVNFAAVVPGEGLRTNLTPEDLREFDYAVGLYVFQRR